MDTDIRKDTVYINAFQQDSVYVYENKLIDRSRDTIYIRDKSIEFRYRKLTDTLRIVQRDSLPYEVRVTEIKEVKYTPPWIQYLAWAGGLFILLLFIRLTLKIKLLR